ncbi:MAG: transglycosylase domain-containing protein [Bacteriovoracia bacterium]
MRLWIRRLAWASAVIVPILLVLAFFGLRSVSAELEEKFHASVDSVPTKVYSGLYWLRPGVGASAEELRYRLHEREYKDVGVAENVRAPGTFAIQLDEQKQLTLLTISTVDFQYPAVAKEVLFGNPQAATGPAKYSVFWRDGQVEKVLDVESAEISGGFALEPILVAQLNEGNAQARKTVTIAQIPHTLMKAIVLTEDQRFLEHGGIDPRGIIRSIYVNLRSGSYVQGASTITQQLARNIYLSRERTITRKLKEMAVSLLLELKFSKDEILEKYLNEVYFGQSGSVAVHGVSEAAKFYFDKNLDDLTVAEQALLAGIVKGPFFYSPIRHFDRAKARQEVVLTKMSQAGVITEAQYKSALAEKLRFARVNPVQNRAPYFTDMVQAQLVKDLPEQEVLGAGYTIFSTLDTYYQHLAETSVAAGVATVEGRLKQFVEKEKKAKAKKSAKQKEENPGQRPDEEMRLVQGVFIAVDPANGHLLGLVGGRAYEESTYNRALLMRRQIGSLIKPFVYLTALIYGRAADGTPLSAISKFEDKPFTYEFDGKSWTPKNYEDEFAGMVTLRFALANSINTVAAQVAIATGLDKVVEVAKLAGFESDIQPLPSLSLGAIGVPPMEVATAYTTLANFGLRRELTATILVVGEDGRAVARYQPREERALPPEETANLVNLMTSVFEIGTAKGSRAAGFVWPAAGKTGTTNEFRDAWFAGFSRKLLGISWIGFDRDDEIVRKHRKALKLTGAVAALPVWSSFMANAHKDQASQALAYPENALRTIKIDLISGGRATLRCMGDSVVEEVFTYRNAPLYECN